MKSILLTILSIFILTSAQAQNRKYTDAEVAAYIDACKCTYWDHGKAETFRSMKRTDPFKYTKNILYISYKNIDSANLVPYVKDGFLNSLVIIEQHVLSNVERDSLVKTLYNYGYQKEIKQVLVFECKQPENAIVYLDKNNKVITATNICFSGTGNSWWNSKDYKGNHKSTIGVPCFGKYEMLEKLFRNAGIKHIK